MCVCVCVRETDRDREREKERERERERERKRKRESLREIERGRERERTNVTGSHKMVDKLHFGTIEIFIYSERRENADYCGENMIVVSAKIKKLWRVKVSGGES